MTFFEDPDYTGKAPEHVANAIKNLSEFGKTSIIPSSKKYEIIITKITEPTIFTNKYDKKVVYNDGYLLSHKSKDLFYEILADIKAIPDRKYLPISKGKTFWVIPVSSEKELADFIEKYSLDSPIEATTPKDSHDIHDVPFEVGEHVKAYFIYDSIKRSADVKISSISIAAGKEYLIKVVFLETSGYKKGADANFTYPFAKDYYLERPIAFEEDEIVMAHWNIGSGYYEHPARITKIEPKEIHFILHGLTGTFDLAGDIIKPGETFGFDYPFKYPAQFLTHIEPKTKEPSDKDDFKVGEIVIATWGDEDEHTFLASGDASIIASDSEMWKVKLLKETGSGDHHWPEGHVLIYRKDKPFSEYKNLKHKSEVEDSFKVGDLVQVHWELMSGTKYEAEGVIKKIEADSYTMVLNESGGEGSLFDKGENIKTRRRGHYGYDPAHYIVLKTSSMRICDDTYFKVGDLVIVHWKFGVNKFNGNGVITKKTKDKYFVETLGLVTSKEGGSTYPKGFEVTINIPFTKNDWLEHKTKKILSEVEDIFSVGDLVNAYWEFDKKPLSAQAKIKKISDPIGYYKDKGFEKIIEVELLETADSRYIKGSPIVFGYPFDKNFYLEHVSVTSYSMTFDIGESVTVHHKTPDKEYVIRGIVHELSPEYVTVKYTETVDMYEKGKLENIPIPINKWNFITKDARSDAPFKVGDIVIARWTSAGDIEYDDTQKAVAEAVITKVNTNSYDVKLLSDVPDTYAHKSMYYIGSYKNIPKEGSGAYNVQNRIEHKIASSILSPEDIKRHDEMLEKKIKRSIIEYFPAVERPSGEKELTDAEISTSINVIAESFMDTFMDTYTDMVKKVSSATHKKVHVMEEAEKCLAKGYKMTRVTAIEEFYVAEAKKIGEKSVAPTELTKMVKQILKLYWPDTKFSVRHKSYSMGDSIDVRWDDGPESSEVQKIVGVYHNKGFDGSTDSSYSLGNPWNTDYIHAQRNY